MNVWELTPEQIRAAGLRALERELGPVGMVRFLQQFSRGSGDYTVDRDSWLSGVDLDSALAQIRERCGDAPDAGAD